jgi:hypothetical protein
MIRNLTDAPLYRRCEWRAEPDYRRVLLRRFLKRELAGPGADVLIGRNESERAASV